MSSSELSHSSLEAAMPLQVRNTASLAFKVAACTAGALWALSPVPHGFRLGRPNVHKFRWSWGFTLLPTPDQKWPVHFSLERSFHQ